MGPNETGYPGGFPNGFINKIRRKWWGSKRLWLFSGSFKDEGGTTVDIDPNVNPDIICDCAKLPFDNESFDFVCADPPYSETESWQFYNLPYFNMIYTLNEMERVCKPGGYIILLHRLIPQVHPKLSHGFRKLELIGIVGIFIVTGFSNLRALTVWRKPERLGVLA